MRKLILALALALFAVASVAAPVAYADPPPGQPKGPTALRAGRVRNRMGTGLRPPVTMIGRQPSPSNLTRGGRGPPAPS